MRPSAAFWIAAALTGLTAAVAVWAWNVLPAGAGVPVNYLGLDGIRHHGVSRIVPGTAPSELDVAGRFNLTFRQY